MFMYKYLQDVLTILCFTFQLRDLFSAHTPLVRYPFYTPLFSPHNSETHCTLFLQWNALPYIGKFDGQAAFGIYGLAATCGHNNTNQTLQPVALNINTTHTPYNAATAALRLRPVYGCSQAMVMVNLQFRPIYSCGQSTVTANLQLRSIYGYGQSAVAANLQLRPIYGYGQSTVAATLFCYYSILGGLQNGAQSLTYPGCLQTSCDV